MISGIASPPASTSLGEAIEQCQAAVALRSDFPRAYEMLAQANELRGQYGEAVDAYQKFLTLQGVSGAEVTGLTEAYATSGQEGYWRWRLETEKRRDVRARELARIYSALGETDLAVEQLEKFFDESGMAASVFGARMRHPGWDPIRSDPRFQDLLRRMNLEP